MSSAALPSLLLALSLAGAASVAQQSESDAFDAAYDEMAGLRYSSLVSELDGEIEWLLLGETAAPPDLQHLIEEKRAALYGTLKSSLCTRDSPSPDDKRHWASRAVDAGLSPIDPIDRGRIAGILVRIYDDAERPFCTSH